MAKIWNKGFDADKLVEAFTVGKDREFDVRLAKYDIIGSMAHIKMLAKIGLLEAEEEYQEIFATSNINQNEIVDPLNQLSKRQGKISIFEAFWQGLTNFGLRTASTNRSGRKRKK